MLFLSVRGFSDYAGPDNPLAYSVVVVLPPSTRKGVGILFHRLFEAQSPCPPMPLSTLQTTPRGVARKTRGQDGFAVLLSHRALSSPTTCRFIPALSESPTTRKSSLPWRRPAIRYDGYPMEYETPKLPKILCCCFRYDRLHVASVAICTSGNPS